MFVLHEITTWKSQCMLSASLLYYSLHEADTYKHILKYAANKQLSFLIAVSTSPMWNLLHGNPSACFSASLLYYSAYKADTYKHIPIYAVNKQLSFVIAVSTSPIWNLSRLFLGTSCIRDYFTSGVSLGCLKIALTY